MTHIVGELRGVQGKETMIHQRTETESAAGKHHPELPPRSWRERLAEAPQPEIDLERVVWDPEYRDEVRRRLRTAAPERPRRMLAKGNASTDQIHPE